MFRNDLNRFRDKAKTNVEEAQGIIKQGPFPPEIIGDESGDLSPHTLRCYEELYTVDSAYGDPELLWKYIRPPGAPAIPPLDLGKRIQLKKYGFYFRVCDLHTEGKSDAEISTITAKPLPTIRSALKQIKKLIGFDPPKRRLFDGLTASEDVLDRCKIAFVQDWRNFYRDKHIGCWRVKCQSADDQWKSSNRKGRSPLFHPSHFDPPQETEMETEMDETPLFHPS
jgi:hypothetical protein